MLGLWASLILEPVNFSCSVQVGLFERMVVPGIAEMRFFTCHLPFADVQALLKLFKYHIYDCCYHLTVGVNKQQRVEVTELDLSLLR